MYENPEKTHILLYMIWWRLEFNIMLGGGGEEEGVMPHLLDI